MGNITCSSIVEVTREMIRDLQAGFRQFAHKPLFSVLAVLLLSVGIGANVLIFGFIDTLILKPLPVRNPQNLWLLEGVREQQVRPNVSFSYGQFLELSKRSDLFTGATAEESWGSESAYPSTDTSGVHLVMTQMLAPNYFREIGVTAQLGRVLTEGDAKPSTNVPALISYQFWQSHYGGRPDIIGQIIRLKNYPFTIVGVLPRDFHSVDIERAPDVRLPISAAPFLLEGKQLNEPRTASFYLLVRLRPGVDPRIAQAAVGEPLHKSAETEFLLSLPSRHHVPTPSEVQSELHWIYQEHLVLEPAGYGVSRLRTQFSRALNLLMAGVIALLIAVCANVAGLLMARGEERRKELAVRLSIGASRWRLLRQLMIENLLLAIPGGAFGLLFAYALAPSLLRILPPVRSLDQFASPQILTLTPDLRVLLFAWLALLVSIGFFGLIPAWHATRLDLNSELKGTTTLASHSLASLIPVAVQVMLSVLLLAAGGLLLRSYWNLQHLNPGFDRAHVLTGRV
jgi:predicted permease